MNAEMVQVALSSFRLDVFDRRDMQCIQGFHEIIFPQNGHYPSSHEYKLRMDDSEFSPIKKVQNKRLESSA